MKYKMKYKSTTFQIIQLIYDIIDDYIKEKYNEIFVWKKLTLEERIDWCSKQSYFDPFDFAVGKYSTDKKYAQRTCDKYGAPKYHKK